MKRTERVRKELAINPPKLKSSWDLELLPNTSQGNTDSPYFTWHKDKNMIIILRHLGWNGVIVFNGLLPDDSCFLSRFNDAFYKINRKSGQGGCCSSKRLMVQKLIRWLETPEETDDDNLIWFGQCVQNWGIAAKRTLKYYQARTLFAHPKANVTIENKEKVITRQDYLYWAGWWYSGENGQKVYYPKVM